MLETCEREMQTERTGELYRRKEQEREKESEKEKKKARKKEIAKIGWKTGSLNF